MNSHDSQVPLRINPNSPAMAISARRTIKYTPRTHAAYPASFPIRAWFDSLRYSQCEIRLSNITIENPRTTAEMKKIIGNIALYHSGCSL